MAIKDNEWLLMQWHYGYQMHYNSCKKPRSESYTLYYYMTSKGPFEGDENVPYLDCSGGYTILNICKLIKMNTQD